ncbi:MAG TPA: hypothetical protein VFT37_12005 [Telluria sp.]|nr:hypothetical protein [Telluria sp.]
MSHLTLVLPFSLPPKELAPDLERHLKAPALAAILSKSASDRSTPGPGTVRQLPHELWLARALDLDGDAPAFARAAMRGFGLDAGDAHWFIVHPAQIEIARSHLLLTDLRQLELSDAHSRALYATALPYFEESGLALAYGDAATWFMRADDWRGMETASPDAAAGHDISFFMPAGEPAIRFRKLQNEIQMLWHEHPANREREAARKPAVNAFWPWAGGGTEPQPLNLYASGAQPWLEALATGGKADPAAVIAAPGERTAWCDQLTGPVIGADWSAWLVAMEELEREWFAPALDAVRNGTLDRLSLVLSSRELLLETSTTRLAQRKFWRRATLDKLFK